MQTRVRIWPDGRVEMQTISMLEDMWHDFEFFKARGAELDRESASPTDCFVAKRYYRAALLSLVSYLEGVVNQWLKRLLPTEWDRMERFCLDVKMEAIEAGLPTAPAVKHRVEDAKDVRNKLVHFKPGTDVELHNKVTAQLLEETEGTVTAWLQLIETGLNFQRHPDTRLLQAPYLRRLGITVGTEGTEGYTSSE